MITPDRPRLARLFSTQALLALLAGLCWLLAWLAPQPALSAGFQAAGAAFAVAVIGATLARAIQGRRRKKSLENMGLLVEHDIAACMLADLDGTVLHANRAAGKTYGAAPGGSLRAVLGAQTADATGLIHRVQSEATRDGIATESVVLPDRHMRVCAHQVGPDAFLWRFELFEERDPAGNAAMRYPTLTLGRGGTVLWMNEAARALAGGRVRSISDLIEDTPLRPGAVHHVDTQGPVSDFTVNIHQAGAGREEVILVPSTPPAVQGADGGFEALPVPLLKLTAKGVIELANRSAREMLSIGPEDEATLSDVMEGLGRSIPDWLSDAAAGKGLARSEFLRLTRSDREVFVQVTLTRIVEDGRTLLVAVLNDATELKSLEAQFVQSQKMQAIGQLAGGVAHDFNNLLTAISGHCDLLLLRHDQGDPEYGDLIQIHQNANRAAGLVGQLLAFSRKQTLRPERLDLRDTLSDLTHLLNRLVGEKVALELRQSAVLPPIRADKRQLEQVIMNLVVNARDAMADGGTIRIETAERDLDQPMDHGRAKVPAGNYVVVRVEDEGTGIALDKLEKVFEPFYTTKRTGEGTGLGLSTVYGIVKQTGGFIFVDSALGKGSVFTLMFPVCDDPVTVAPAPMPQTVPEPAARADGVVLLVEDEAPVRAFASRALAHRGFKVIEAGCAEDALELLQDEALRIDVFVTDVVMPGLDGPSWVRQARAQRPDVPVVFMSGYAEDVFKSQGARIESSAFLAKPFSLTDLTSIVNQQLVAGTSQTAAE
ncbi:PAS domain-containing hybrid sensor histidine kinase/response regulator [Marivita sp. GX14005]|uniref:hybrid sensor histidine kinase/response regulator n=1 Tax=Marivita sp. GX14005 TaxID=2942276 RepID=UPI002019DE6F|nr:PAS domain-containing hybrid sensor histidine kinase/response regulator [Marivita sp. GX14005]MCL3883740.1 ATP-binding protein [Marivita sp. GX14005]